MTVPVVGIRVRVSAPFHLSSQGFVVNFLLYECIRICERKKGRMKEERTSERKGELEEARGLEEYKRCVCVRARRSWICVEKYKYACLVLSRGMSHTCLIHVSYMSHTIHNTIHNTSDNTSDTSNNTIHTSNQKERTQSNRKVLLVRFCGVCHYMLCVCAIERESAHVRACERASERKNVYACACVCVCACMCVCTNEFMHVCLCVCVFVRISVWVCEHHGHEDKGGSCEWDFSLPFGLLEPATHMATLIPMPTSIPPTTHANHIKLVHL